jgi:hypothetical protein
VTDIHEYLDIPVINPHDFQLLPFSVIIASVAQLAARSAVNRKVAGSIPAGSDCFFWLSFFFFFLSFFLSFAR